MEAGTAVQTRQWLAAREFAKLWVRVMMKERCLDRKMEQQQQRQHLDLEMWPEMEDDGKVGKLQAVQHAKKLLLSSKLDITSW